jgi:hypothetical protein
MDPLLLSANRRERQVGRKCVATSSGTGGKSCLDCECGVGEGCGASGPDHFIKSSPQGPWLFTGVKCEVEVFNTHNRTFKANANEDKGTSTGGRAKVVMTWAKGALSAAIFNGSSVGSTYQGTFTFQGTTYVGSHLAFGFRKCPTS